MTHDVRDGEILRQREFRLEREMVPMVSSWLSSSGLIVSREFVTPWGICDLVGIDLHPDRVRHRIKLGQRLPIGSLTRTSILQHIPDEESGRGITVDHLREKLGVNTQIYIPLEEELKILEARRFVQVDCQGYIRKRNGWVPLQRRVVAVELKLNRVSDAFSQAQAHQVFADECYIAVPKMIATRLTTHHRSTGFQETGIGVLAVERHQCNVVLPAKPDSAHIDPTIQMHAVERLWKGTITGKSA